MSVIFILASLSAISQDTLPNKYNRGLQQGPFAGVIYHDKTFLTIGGIFAEPYRRKETNAAFGFGADVCINSDAPILGPRLFFGVSWAWAGFRMSFVDYYKGGKEQDLRFIPEAYINMSGLVYLSYGYSMFFFSPTILGEVGEHRVSLVFNFVKRK
jgi:hypothetical protein